MSKFYSMFSTYFFHPPNNLCRYTFKFMRENLQFNKLHAFENENRDILSLFLSLSRRRVYLCAFGALVRAISLSRGRNLWQRKACDCSVSNVLTNFRANFPSRLKEGANNSLVESRATKVHSQDFPMVRQDSLNRRNPPRARALRRITKLRDD